MPITLPTTKSEINLRFTDQKIGLIGASGIGKSTFFSFGDKTLYMQTEAGLNHLSVIKVPIRSFNDLKELLTALIQADQSGKFPYDCIVIDTIDELIDLINEEVIRRGREKFTKLSNEINTIGDIPNGAGWQWATELIKLTFDKLEKLPACIAFVGHLENKEVKTATDKYHKQTLSIGGKTGLWLTAWTDHFLNVESTMNGQQFVRKVRTRPTQYVEAKSRGNVVPDGWQWIDSMQENWNKFRGLFK
jgi:hypothetical protein